jgi:pyruvate kinase
MTRTTKHKPHPHLSKSKRTKIVATIGPATASYEQILQVVKHGADCLRLNFSHGTHEEFAQFVKWIRKASKEYVKPLAIVQDLQGPKIRLGDFDGVVNVRSGQSLSLKYKADYERTGHLPIQYDLSKKVKRGERLLLYDGKVRTHVTAVREGVVFVRADNNGILIKRKGINLPDTNFSGDIITAKDKRDIVFGSTLDVDYVAMSFVHTAEDIRQLRTILKNLGSDVKILAKIETTAAMRHIEEIVQEADAIMIARGDLAVETAPETVPIAQRKIVSLGMHYAKPTIVATQMLGSMTESPEPTRAEVSDVATAVLMGADAVMLSEETAMGKYPVEAVGVMRNVILYAQQHDTYSTAVVPTSLKNRQAAICNAIISLADEIRARAIVASTRSGATALQLASRRPTRALITVTSDQRVAQQLALVYGTKNYVRPDQHSTATKLTSWLKTQGAMSDGDVIVSASGQYPGVVGTTDTIKVRVL